MRTIFLANQLACRYNLQDIHLLPKINAPVVRVLTDFLPRYCLCTTASAVVRFFVPMEKWK
jgi:hypothetical protein